MIAGTNGSRFSPWWRGEFAPNGVKALLATLPAGAH
jgi:hypothetical protein